MKNSPPLIVHVIYRLDVGGLENGLVNLINRIPEDRYRHAILCLKGYSESFRSRIKKPVEVHDLGKKEGQDVAMQFRLWKLLRKLKPDIVHTRNLGTLEASVPSALAGIKVRIHGEHGFDIGNIEGNNKKDQYIRRLYSPFITRYIALSRSLGQYLEEKTGIAQERISQIYNGVDAMKFYPAEEKNRTLPFSDPSLVVFGTVGRMQAVKDQTSLARAFIRMLEIAPHYRERARLMMIGEGSLRNDAIALLEDAGCSELSWLPGSRDDIADIMRQMDVFVLPSLSEGISNTILEAMATGLPVIATNVGGNPELVEDGVTGTLIPPSDPEIMARTMLTYLTEPDLPARQSIAARSRIEQNFSLESMVSAYMKVYDDQLAAG